MRYTHSFLYISWSSCFWCLETVPHRSLKTRAEYKVFCGFSVFYTFGRTFLRAGCFFLFKILIEKETVCTIFESWYDLSFCWLFFLELSIACSQKQIPKPSIVISCKIRIFENVYFFESTLRMFYLHLACVVDT